MTTAELELLNQSVGGASRAFLANRELSQRQSQDTERNVLTRLAQQTAQKHYDEETAAQKRREENEKGYHEETLKRLDNVAAAKAAEVAAKEAAQKFKEYQSTQQNYIKLLGSQVAANRANPKLGLSNEDAHNQFVSHLQDLAMNNGDMFDKLTKDPSISTMLKPTFDFAAVPSVSQSNVTPVEFKDSTGNSLSGIMTGKGAFHATPKPVTPKTGTESTSTQVTYDPLTQSNHTNTTSRVTRPIGTAPQPMSAAPLPAPTGQPTNDELSRAMSAIQAGKDPDAVRALYKQRTGQDLPQ